MSCNSCVCGGITITWSTLCQWFQHGDVHYAMLQKIGLPQTQALSETMSAELAMSGVPCVLSWHSWYVLSQGQVHYQCVECRVCWAGTSCHKDKSTTSVLSAACVELAHVVRTTVVVRVTDRWHGAVGQAMRSDIHLKGARHFVDHPLSGIVLILPTWVNMSIIISNFVSKLITGDI